MSAVASRHPRLVVLVALGAVGLVAGFVLGRSDQLLGIRLALIGGVAFVAGAAGVIALEAQRAIDGSR